jgi:hypothetical protein
MAGYGKATSASHDTWRISSHHITCICHVAVCCIATSPNPMLHGSTTLSHIRQTVPHDTVSLVHVSKWAPPQPRQPPNGSHQSATWQSAIRPHHHPMPHGITTSMHTGVIFSVIAMCQALIRPLSLKPMTPQHNMTHGTALLVPCQLITSLIEANPER